MTGARRLQAACRRNGSTSKPSEWDRLLEGHTVGQFTSFDAAPDAPNTIDLAGRRHEGFARARTAQGVNLFDVVAEHVKAANAAGRRVLVAGYTEGSASRLQHLLQEHGATTPVPVADFATVQGLPPGALGVAVWPLEHGFVLDGLEVIGEEDILGDRLSRPAKKRRPSERFIAEAAALERRRPGRPSRARHRPLRRPGHARDPVRAARLPAADLRRRRQAVRAGREHRRAEPLRRGGGGRRPRPAGRRRLAVAQGAAEAAHRRHGRPADQDRRRARHPPRRDDEPAGRRSTRSSAPASPMPRPTTSCRPSPTCWTTCRPASRWTG